MSTLAIGSFSLIALAAANDAVPAPMRTYGANSNNKNNVIKMCTGI